MVMLRENNMEWVSISFLNQLWMVEIVLQHHNQILSYAIYFCPPKKGRKGEEAFYCIKSLSFAQLKAAVAAAQKYRVAMGMEKQKQKGEREMLRQIAEVFLECYTAFECMKRALLLCYATPAIF